ncbi:MAG: DUF4352 domain-containing protein [Enterococcus sp.]|uniref:DUF4352 domain-containing protein n=1 Tax=Enterococcus sp. TaxID=35783 RepID=UPI0026494F21|nr:DUF4352 domain-containing protein [Enterococcus sp.]MDN6004799.1 DUF4352 domain-containing protein [Enterococcus sp.]MDN6218424.1 DUF4352 domain-containing protein [Enterococcus sp.]MDN6563138.1 DUF4352 domain-containing protein [Enterococcus sp.]MDN6650365.1 DUF4352 domain-containing protein [Enterococcus sp.]MDN6775408.1 DUF4352 domain-containing protein [Enterococcus sp.]
MKKNKVISTIILLSSVLFVASSCSSSESKPRESETSKNANVELSIDKGGYVIPDGKDSDGETGFLALTVNVKNKTDDELSVSVSDFALYGEDGEKVSSERVYDSEGNFRVMGSETLSEDKSFTGSLVFEVEKANTYELHYRPSLPSGDEKANEIELKVNTKQYKDEAKDVENLVKEYVSTVFYDSDEDETNSKLKLGNDLEAERKMFKEDGVKRLQESFTSYEVTSQEAEKIVAQFQASNKEKAQVTYKYKEFFPETATIYVHPETVLLDKIDRDALVKQFAEENKGKYTNYSTAQKEGEKYLVQELPEKIKETPISTEENMAGEGYRVNLVKKEGKWELNSSKDSKNYSFNSLKASFRGGLKD